MRSSRGMTTCRRCTTRWSPRRLRHVPEYLLLHARVATNSGVSSRDGVDEVVSFQAHWQPQPCWLGAWSTANQITMHWSKTMSDPQVKLSESRSQFEDHFSSQERGRSRGIKPFERWMWWAEKHQNDGAKPRPDAWWEASASRRNALAVANNADPWQLVGPDEVPIHGGAGRINRIRISNNSWHACAPAGGLWISEDEGQRGRSAGWTRWHHSAQRTWTRSTTPTCGSPREMGTGRTPTASACWSLGMAE